MSSNTDIEELRKEIDKIWNIEVSKSEFENIVIKIADIIQQKVIEARIDEQDIVINLMRGSDSDYVSLAYHVLRRAELLTQNLEIQSQLNHNKKGDSDGSN